MLSDVCLSRTSGISREQRGPMKTTHVAHVTRDSDTTFIVKRYVGHLMGFQAYDACAHILLCFESVDTNLVK